MTLIERLKKLGACCDAMEWIGDRDLATAWSECRRPDWLLWLCGRMAGEPGWPSRQLLLLVACDIAESVLPIFEAKYPQDARPRKSIEAARKWVYGKASISEVRAARRAADAAAYAAAYADAAAAAYAAAAAAAAAYADAAAAAAAYAAAAAAAAAYADAAACTKKAKHIELCALIRDQIKIPEVF